MDHSQIALECAAVWQSEFWSQSMVSKTVGRRQAEKVMGCRSTPGRAIGFDLVSDYKVGEKNMRREAQGVITRICEAG